MAPGSVRAESMRSSHSDNASAMSTATGDDDYGSFLSDVLVVGAGPAGLMLAYVTATLWP
jgi:ribulose 1,5-bisphosphate synthetase/thiazole synthase